MTSFELGFFDKCAAHGLTSAAMTKVAARGDMISNLVGRADDAIFDFNFNGGSEGLSHFSPRELGVGHSGIEGLSKPVRWARADVGSGPWPARNAPAAGDAARKAIQLRARLRTFLAKTNYLKNL